MSDRCKKVRYPGEPEARNALKKIHRQTRGNPGKRRQRKECRVYQCEYCHGWHLTSWRKHDACG